MKVKELQELLKDCNPDHEIFCIDTMNGSMLIKPSGDIYNDDRCVIICGASEMDDEPISSIGTIGRSKFNRGEFLYKLPQVSEVTGEVYPDKDKRVFIHSGFESGDGVGVLIGWNGDRIEKSTGWGNMMWGGYVRKATSEEAERFMQQLMNYEPIKPRR